MTKGTIVVEIQCSRCRGTVLDIPDEAADDPTQDPLVTCANCGNIIGPYKSVQFAAQGQAHSMMGGHAIFTVKRDG